MTVVMMSLWSTELFMWFIGILHGCIFINNITMALMAIKSAFCVMYFAATEEINS